MNLEKLQIAQQDFLLAFPAGFQHPKMLEVGKKHKMDKMIEFAQEVFSKSAFNLTDRVLESWVKVVSRSSMVSMFEKPKFKDMVNDLPARERELLADGLYEFLFGDQQKGFEQQLDILAHYKLAKWSLISIVPAYVSPQKEVFVKPTTAKGVIKHFDLQGLEYKAKPSWEFYQEYRKQILAMSDFVDPSLKPNTAAFCGFLMMSLPK